MRRLDTVYSLAMATSHIPEFSPWHLQRMRMRLKAYKLMNGFAWIDVADAIMCSKTNDFTFPELSGEEEKRLDALHRIGSSGPDKREKQDLGWPVQSQDLLRFADGKTDRQTGLRQPRGLKPEKLSAICAFLQDQRFLSTDFKAIRKEDIPYAAIYAMLDHTGLSAQDLIDAKLAALEGDYKNRRELDDKILSHRLTFLLSPDGRFYSVNEILFSQCKATRTIIGNRALSGWAVLINRDGLMIFLADNADTGTEGQRYNGHAYGLHQIGLSGDDIQSLTLLPFDKTQILPADDSGQSLTSGTMPELLEFSRFYGKICDVPVKSDKSMEDEKRKPLAFQGRGAMLERWKRIQAQRQKGGQMSDPELNKKFLRAAQEGEYWNVRACMDSGADVNYQDPVTKAHALHLVAVFNAKPALKELIKSSELKYLVFDHKNRLPSQIAWEFGNNPVIGTFLQKKEMAEAKAGGLDYRELLARAETFDAQI